MRILHTVPSVGKISGGLGQIAVGFSKYQRLCGIDAEIWCLDKKGDDVDLLFDDLTREYIKTYPIIGPSKIGYSHKMLSDAISAKDIDIIHQHGIWTAFSYVVNRWRSINKKPTIITPHGTLENWCLKRSVWKKRLAYFFYEKKNLLNASCLHATSDMEALSFRKFGLMNPIAVIPNAISDDWLSSVGNPDRFRSKFFIPQDKRLMLFLSRIHPKKGLPLLFEAISKNREELKNWHLVIAGPDELDHRKELVALQKKYNIDEKIQFVGPLYGQDKRDAFSASDIFVLSTYSENFGIVVAEALAAGIPVLTTKGAPWNDLETFNCGWWVSADLPSIEKGVLQSTKHSKKELIEMGKRGKKLVREKYSWHESTAKSIKLYNWLLGNDSRPDFVIIG